MACYVDALQVQGAVGRIPAGTEWCHLFADTEAELHEIAEAIGMKRKWFQDKGPNRLPHYDLVASKRILALKYGARELPEERSAWLRIYLRLKAQWGRSTSSIDFETEEVQTSAQEAL